MCDVVDVTLSVIISIKLLQPAADVGTGADDNDDDMMKVVAQRIMHARRLGGTGVSCLPKWLLCPLATVSPNYEKNGIVQYVHPERRDVLMSVCKSTCVCA